MRFVAGCRNALLTQDLCKGQLDFFAEDAAFVQQPEVGLSSRVYLDGFGGRGVRNRCPKGIVALTDD